MADIKRISKCFEEVKRLTGDLISDEQINEILDEDSIEEIYEYFMEAETPEIGAAEEEFDGDFTEEELRAVRIKFFSEVAN